MYCCSSRRALMQIDSLQDRQLSALQHPLDSETLYKVKPPSFHTLCCDISGCLTLATFHHHMRTATKSVTTFPKSALSPVSGPPQILSNFGAAMTCTCKALMACNFSNELHHLSFIILGNEVMEQMGLQSFGNPRSLGLFPCKMLISPPRISTHTKFSSHAVTPYQGHLHCNGGRWLTDAICLGCTG